MHRCALLSIISHLLAASLKKNTFALHIYYTRLPMQPTKDQLHQIWLQCMQMTQCTPQAALSFLSQVHPVLNTPLTLTGQTLPMLAASSNAPNLLKAALHYHPQLHLTDSIGRTALHYAAAVGNIEIFQILVQAGCRVDAQTIGGETPLTKACLFSQGQIIEWYLNNSLPTFEIEDKMGKKPLDGLKNGGEALYDEVIEVYRQLTQDTAMKE